MSINDPRDNTLGGYGSWGAGQPTYNVGAGGLGGGAGVDTLTINSGGSISNALASGVSYTTGPYTLNSSYSSPSNVKIDGDGIVMEAGTDITIAGKKLSETISKLEERLAILHPNPVMESKWDELKSLGDRYRELEKELYEKEKMWKILKEK